MRKEGPERTSLSGEAIVAPGGRRGQSLHGDKEGVMNDFVPLGLQKNGRAE